MKKSEIVKLDPIDISIKLSKAREQRNTSREIFNKRDRGKKSFLARIIADYRLNADGKVSEEKLEKSALADPRLKAYEESMNDEEKLQNECQEAYEFWVDIKEAMRDMNATKRTEMKIL